MSETLKPEKTPVHSVVAVICDILTPLTNDERVRAMDAIATSLGIDYQAGRPPVAPIVQERWGAAEWVAAPEPLRRPTPNAQGGTFRGGGGSSVKVFPLRRMALPRGNP